MRLNGYPKPSRIAIGTPEGNAVKDFHIGVFFVYFVAEVVRLLTQRLPSSRSLTTSTTSEPIRSGSRETSDAATSRFPKSHDFDYVRIAFKSNIRHGNFKIQAK